MTDLLTPAELNRIADGLALMLPTREECERLIATLRHRQGLIDDWADAWDRYRTGPEDKPVKWADNPKSVGALFIRGQIDRAEDKLRAVAQTIERPSLHLSGLVT